MMAPVGGRLQGWFPLTGLPWNLPAVPGICAGCLPTLDCTSSQAHQLVTSLIAFQTLTFKEVNPSRCKIDSLRKHGKLSEGVIHL